MSNTLSLHGKDTLVIFWLIQLLFGFGPVEQMRIEKGDSSRITLWLHCISTVRKVSGVEHSQAGD